MKPDPPVTSTMAIRALSPSHGLVAVLSQFCHIFLLKLTSHHSGEEIERPAPRSITTISADCIATCKQHSTDAACSASARDLARRSAHCSWSAAAIRPPHPQRLPARQRPRRLPRRLRRRPRRHRRRAAEIPQETEGPYPADGSNGPTVLTSTGVVRSDIRSSFAGHERHRRRRAAEHRAHDRVGVDVRAAGRCARCISGTAIAKAVTRSIPRASRTRTICAACRKRMRTDR